MESETTKKSIATRMREAGVEFDQVHKQDGSIRWVINGDELTPGQAEARYLKDDPQA
jgi:hypothetical protein